MESARKRRRTLRVDWSGHYACRQQYGGQQEQCVSIADHGFGLLPAGAQCWLLTMHRLEQDER